MIRLRAANKLYFTYLFAGSYNRFSVILFYETLLFEICDIHQKCLRCLNNCFFQSEQHSCILSFVSKVYSNYNNTDKNLFITVFSTTTGTAKAYNLNK